MLCPVGHVQTIPRVCIYPGYYPTKNFCKFCRTFMLVPRTTGSSVRHSHSYPELLELLYCTPVATVPGVRVQHVLYPLGTSSVSSVRLRHNTRSFWKFCKTFVPEPRTSGSSVRSPYPHPKFCDFCKTGTIPGVRVLPLLQYPGSPVFIHSGLIRRVCYALRCHVLSVTQTEHRTAVIQ